MSTELIRLILRVKSIKGAALIFIFVRKAVFFVSALILVCALLTPFLASGSVFAWLAGFCYVLYDTFLLMFVAYQVSRFLKNSVDFKKQNLQKEISITPSIGVVIPARNENLIIRDCLTSILAQLSHIHEVLIVDDGSEDETILQLENSLSLDLLSKQNEKRLYVSRIYPKVRVLAKSHTGKSDSLNQAIDYFSSDVLITLDADTIIDLDAVAVMQLAFASNPKLVAAGGVLVPFCKPTLWGKIFQTFQRFEYIRAFLSRQAWMNQHSLLLVSGAFAAYRTEALKEIGRYDTQNWVEDYELIHRFYFHFAKKNIPIEIGVIREARGVTDCPESLFKFLRQRRRWFGGFLQTLYKYRSMIGRKEFHKVGTQMLPIKLIDTLQPLYGLASLYALTTIFYFKKTIPNFILGVLIAKLIIDLLYHFYCILLYNRWQKRRQPLQFWFFSVVVTFCEPIFFQPLRHFGAALGWIAFLSFRKSKKHLFNGS